MLVTACLRHQRLGGDWRRRSEHAAHVAERRQRWCRNAGLDFCKRHALASFSERGCDNAVIERHRRAAGLHLAHDEAVPRLERDEKAVRHIAIGSYEDTIGQRRIDGRGEDRVEPNDGRSRDELRASRVFDRRRRCCRVKRRYGRAADDSRD